MIYDYFFNSCVNPLCGCHPIPFVLLLQQTGSRLKKITSPPLLNSGWHLSPDLIDTTEDRGKWQRLYLRRNQRNKRREGSISGGTSRCHFAHSPAKPERSFVAFSEWDEEHPCSFSPHSFYVWSTPNYFLSLDRIPKPGTSLISRYL